MLLYWFKFKEGKLDGKGKHFYKGKLKYIGHFKMLNMIE